MRTVAVIACAALFAGGSAPQQAVPQQPVFKSGVELVALDVTVVDKDGKPVTGLKASDFVVTVNGKPGAVRQMDYLTFGAAPGTEVAVTARESSNQTAAAVQASRGGRVIVILIDDLSARAGQGKGLTVAAERMLTSLDMGDLVGLATTSGLGPAMSPTRDRAAVLATLKSKGVVGRKEDVAAPFFIAVQEAIEIERDIRPRKLNEVAARECGAAGMSVDVCASLVKWAAYRVVRDTEHRSAMQMAAYAQIIRALKPAPAPRVVIALSTGVAVDAHFGFQTLDPVGRAAVESGVQFYAMTEASDPIATGDTSEARAVARREEGALLTAGVQTIATAAGGEAFQVVGQADRFFKRIIAETSGIYRLGVEATLGSSASRFLDVKVSVKRPGVTVRANRHALMPSAKPETVTPAVIDEALRTRIASGGVAFGVPIALATALRRDPAAGGELQLGVNVQMPAGISAPLIAMYALVDGAGKVVKAGKQAVPAALAGDDYQLAFPIPLSPGAYRLRFAVADALGNIGSVEHGVEARLAHLGAVSVSDLFTTWVGTDGRRRLLALETLPDDAASLRAFLELYPDNAAADPAAVTVRLTLVRTGETVPVFEREVTPIRDGAALSAGAEIPVDALAPGNYTIRATVLESGAVTGTVTTQVRKAG